MPDVAAYLKGAANVVAEGLMTHFASSENRDQLGLNQVALFREAMDLLKLSGVEPRIIHMANSGAITRYPEAHFDMVRLGISLYGSHPGPGLTGGIAGEAGNEVCFPGGFREEFFLPVCP